ncbi:MAG TPA: hypothetical protein VF734_09805 [Pseudonocardiaceae bacterium]
MLTVGSDPAGVEVRLSSATLSCPGCSGRLVPWGHGRVRVVRGEGLVRWRLRPRRARCSGCGATHILLPVRCLLRRADAVEVIGAALVAAGAGWGHRRVAELVERPASTVRGWLRRFEARAGPVRAGFTALAVALEPAPVMPQPAGCEVGDAVAAIVVAARGVWVRWPALLLTVSVWQVAAAVTCGGLLAPKLTVEPINTSRLW